MSSATAHHSCGRRVCRPLVVGLTGAIAAGKTTVAAMLRELGAEVIDADEVYRELVSPGTPLLRAIEQRFGPDVVRADGGLNRSALSAVVFRDPLALRSLDALTHPAVVGELRRRIAQSPAPVVLIEAVKLVQAGLLADIDALWVVTARPEVRLRRMIDRGAMSREEAEARIEAASPPLPAEVTADALIDNSGDLNHTRRRVLAAWRALPLPARGDCEAMASLNVKEDS